MAVSTAVAARMRTYRARKNSGRILLVLDLDEMLLADALVDAGYLDLNKKDDEHAIRKAALSFMKFFSQENKT